SFSGSFRRSSWSHSWSDLRVGKEARQAENQPVLTRHILFARVRSGIRLYAINRFPSMQTQTTPTSRATRRGFLRSAGLGLGALGLAGQASFAGDEPPASFAKPSKMRLGLVTYNLAK